MTKSNTNRPFFLLVMLIFSVIIAVSVHAEVRLPHVIGSNMVMQRDIRLPVWGWADSGETISVSLDTNQASVKADKDGSWMVSLYAMKAGGPYHMTIKGKNTITLENIMIGEVWVCSGQSNMQWNMINIDNSRQEIATAEYPDIRLFQIPNITAGEPRNDINAEWCECSNETVRTFSAVAYFFGRDLYRKLNVPVGLINTSWGGTRIEPWTPPVGFEKVPSLQSITDEIKKADTEYRTQIQAFIGDTEQWLKQAKAFTHKGNPVPDPPKIPAHDLDNRVRPTGIYNTMIAPLIPFAFRGAIWYQGESNRGEGMVYHEKMKALIRGWRTVWGQGDFPFYYVQLAPFRYRGGVFIQPELLPEIWEAQTAALSEPNTGMVVTVDICDVNDIHPRNKQEVGRRLSLWALAKDYGQSGLVYSGPLFRAVTFQGNKATVEFDHTGDGLITYDGGDPTWFQISGPDRLFYNAQAKITGHMIEVWSDEVQNPVAVRFAWHEEAEPNLMNSARLPASPFRTDAW